MDLPKRKKAYLASLVAVLALALLVLTIAQYGKISQAWPFKSSHEEIPLSITLTKIDPITAYVERLATFECAGCGDHYRRIDDNGFYSYSCLQFQRATFLAYSRQYGISGDIYDCAVQKRLAAAMLRDDPALWRNWYTSVAVRGLGKPPAL